MLSLIASVAAAKDVVIVTSFPKELFETYKKTFEAKNPGINVVINSKQTNAGVTYLRETKAKPEADIFWVSAPDAFQTLDADGLLEKYAPPKEIMARIPAKIGNFPIHDPDGKYFGFAISGYGLMWNKNYLKAHKLPPPKEWTDLTESPLLQSSDHQRAVAQRHDASDRRNDPASLRLGKRLGAACSMPAATWAALPSAASASRKRSSAVNTASAW